MAHHMRQVDGLGEHSRNMETRLGGLIVSVTLTVLYVKVFSLERRNRQTIRSQDHCTWTNPRRDCLSAGWPGIASSFRWEMVAEVVVAAQSHTERERTLP
jgi:hypothetical protein